MNWDYNVTNSEYYKNHVSKPSIGEYTEGRYELVLTKFCNAVNKDLDDIVKICKEEQDIVTTQVLPPDENGNQRRREIKFDVNGRNSSVKKFCDRYVDFCKERKNKNVTINHEISQIRAFLRSSGVKLPKYNVLEDDSDDWQLLSKEDFNFISQHLSLIHLSLLNFLTSTGMRLGDALSLSIGDFMKATSEYHDFVDVEEFIDNAPDDMVGQWVFEPHKTRNSKVKCITFNSMYASNLILENLRHIKNTYIPSKNKSTGRNSKITKKYALFGSKHKKFKTPLNGKTVSDQWGRKNKKFKEWKINQINHKIKNGELSSEDYEEEVSKIPKFHPHMCRKFFSSTVSNHCGDIRVCALLEGHSDGLPNDSSYIKKNVSDIKDIYVTKIHDALCLSNVETRIVTSKETEELHKKIELLEDQLEEKDEQHQRDSDEIETLKEQLEKQNQRIEETANILTDITTEKTYDSILKAINNYVIDNYFIDNPKEEDLIVYLATDYATQHKEEFEFTEKYIKRLITRIKTRITLDGRNIDEIYDEYLCSDTENFRLLEIVSLIEQKILTSPGLVDLIGDVNDTKLEKMIQNKLYSNYNIDDLSKDDIDKIIEEVVVDLTD